MNGVQTRRQLAHARAVDALSYRIEYGELRPTPVSSINTKPGI